jgi:RNA polymerase-binding protein DksA
MAGKMPPAKVARPVKSTGGKAKVAAKKPAVKVIARTKAPAKKQGPTKKPALAVARGRSAAKKPAEKPAPKAKPILGVKPTVAIKPKVAAPPAAAAKTAHSPVAVAPRPVVVPAPAAPVVKARRSASGLGVRDLQHFADLLLEKRREIVGDMHSMEGEALRSGTSGLSTLPVHMADMGTDNYEQEFTLGLVEKDRTLLREINHALAKIPAGTYGICEGTGDPIGKPRLEVQPWARHSIEYARLRERNGRGVRMF